MPEPVAIVRSADYLEHEPPSYHPENPDRLKAIHAMLADPKWEGRLVEVAPREATARELELNHAAAYVREVDSLGGRRTQMLDPDTYCGPETPRIARLAAGGALAALEAIARGDARKGFALVRPPGHHAEFGRAMGFCLFNNIAVAAHWALEQGLARRVLVMDWDVHHGNGTQHAFWEDPRVLFVSTHRFPFYPGTGNYSEIGKGKGEGFTVNVPLPGGTEDAAYVRVFREIVEPVARRFEPDLVLVSAGFDAHERDPLGGMAVTEAGFGAMATILAGVADDCARGRMLAVLEGGYDLLALERSVARTLLAMGGEAQPTEDLDGDADYAAPAIRKTRTQLAPYWKL